MPFQEDLQTNVPSEQIHRNLSALKNKDIEKEGNSILRSDRARQDVLHFLEDEVIFSSRRMYNKNHKVRRNNTSSIDTVLSEKSNIIEEIVAEMDAEFFIGGASNHGAKRRRSGAGILEFSTTRAGLDVTPANFTFRERSDSRPASGTYIICIDPYYANMHVLILLLLCVVLLCVKQLRV